MANQEHLKKIEEGIDAWNQWRQENPDIQPDLSFTVLVRANLEGANLSDTLLHRTTFTDEAPLGNDFFEGDGLIISELNNADFSYTNFRSSRFFQAHLEKVDISRATMSSTIFRGIDLNQFKGLDSVKHIGPSSIDINTFYQSNGNIPDVFLRGAGVHDTFITYIRSLIGKPVNYYTCFISHSSKDQDFAKRLYADLQREGVRCWFAPEDLDIGDKIRPRIEESIRIYDKLLLVLSENSISSNWVAYEVERAMNKEPGGKSNVLFPVRLDDSVKHSKTTWANDIRSTRHIGDFSNWKDHDEYQKAFNRLLRALKSESEKQ